MSLEAWGDENPDDAFADSWMAAAEAAGWIDGDELRQGTKDVIAERYRQEDAEGFDAIHDDAYENDELVQAACCYVLNTETHPIPGSPPAPWLWGSQWWKPKATRRQNLVVAAALLIAEIERIDRAEEHGEG